MYPAWPYKKSFFSRGCAHVQEQDIAVGNGVTPEALSKINKIISKCIIYSNLRTTTTTTKHAFIVIHIHVGL